MKRIVASSKDEFQDLYDSSREAGLKLEDIIADLGYYEDDFFVEEEDEEPTATEEQYKSVLDAYYGEGGDRHYSAEDVLEAVIDAINSEIPEAYVRTFEDAGLLTMNKGFVISMGDAEYQFEMNGTY